MEKILFNKSVLGVCGQTGSLGESVILCMKIKAYVSKEMLVNLSKTIISMNTQVNRFSKLLLLLL